MANMAGDERLFVSRFTAALERGVLHEVFSPLSGLLDAAAKERLARFASLLLEANREANLTRITDPEEMAVKHVIDSMSALLVGEWPEGALVCDVGTGGGLPGLVLGLVRPDLSITLVDSVAKKLTAVQSIADALGINARTVHARAEELGRDVNHREQYRVVVARAVAALPVLSELCLPLTAVGGQFVAMKGRDSELDQGEYAIRELGGEVRESLSLVLPDDYGERTLLSIVKRQKTPSAYPRRSGLPAKRPLIAAR